MAITNALAYFVAASVEKKKFYNSGKRSSLFCHDISDKEKEFYSKDTLRVTKNICLEKPYLPLLPFQLFFK
jgi:hypothetical protein